MICDCKRCGYHWETRLSKKPKVCPRCKSYFWETNAYKRNVKGQNKNGSLKLGKKAKLKTA